MKLFRNPEIKNNLRWFTLISLIATIIAVKWQVYFGLFTLVLCVLFIAVYLLMANRRHKRISELSESIDKVLHGDNTINFDNCSEGELSILQSELYKMTVCLREQQQMLIADKMYLANSIADISHQIKTPLTSINILVSFLSESNITDERRLSLTTELYDLLTRIDWLIVTLLKISKLDAETIQFKKERISLDELVRKSIAPVLIPMELRGQELCINTKGDFCGDIAWTIEAIGNIVKNCMEHTPESGSISVDALETPLYVQIIISDNGDGIDKDDLPHIFDRFYKGKNSNERSFGIGLALSRMIVTGQNGTIKAENKSPNGAVFTIRFYKATV